MSRKYRRIDKNTKIKILKIKRVVINAFRQQNIDLERIDRNTDLANIFKLFKQDLIQVHIYQVYHGS